MDDISVSDSPHKGLVMRKGISWDLMGCNISAPIAAQLKGNYQQIRQDSVQTELLITGKTKCGLLKRR